MAGAAGKGTGEGKAGRCGKVKGAKVLMIPASRKDTRERENILREIEEIIGEVRRSGGRVDPGLVRAKEAIGDEQSHLLVARSRWGELLGSLSYSFPDPATLRVDYIGLLVRRCGLGTRLMATVAEIALGGNRAIRLTAEKDARGFFAGLGMDLVEEFPDGNCVFESTGDGTRRLAGRARPG